MNKRRANTNSQPHRQLNPPLTLDPAKSNQEIVLARRSLSLTNLNKLFWSRPRLTKRDIINYYYQIAPIILPYLKDRPLTQKRYPQGVIVRASQLKNRSTNRPAGAPAKASLVSPKYFYQKRVPARHPAFVKTVLVRHAGGPVRYVLANNTPTLVWLANLADLEMHPWYGRRGSLNRPDHVVFDLDPTRPRDLAGVRKTALIIKNILADLGLKSMVKSSGSRGLHIYVPIRNNVTYDQTRFFAKWVAIKAHHQAPRLITLKFRLAQRRGVYIDYLQNVRGKTLAAPYSLRAQPRAPVAAPLHWSEVKQGFEIDQFNLKNMPGLIKQRGDLFAPLLQLRQNIKPLIKKINN